MATVEQAPAQPPPQPVASCRRCGAQVAPDQLVCVECGTPAAMGFRRPPSWRLPAALIAGVVLVAGLAAGFVVSELLQDPDADGKASPTVASKPRPQTPPASTTTTPTTLPPATGEPGTTTPTTKAPATPGDSTPDASIRSWPSGKSAFTIVLVSAKSRSQADDRAREAADNDIPAGVLHSDDYEGLKPGFWVVFAGDFDTQRQAERKLDEYARKGFKGAYPRFVDASNKQPGD